NGRIVSVAAGQAKNVDVKLTKSTGSSTAVSPAAAASGGGSLFTNPLFLAAVAGGAVAIYFVTKGGKPPVAGTITAPAVGIVGAGVTFTSTGASDPGGKTLTYTWDFGDGGTGTGQTVNHAYATAGTFTVKLTVKNSDGRSSSAPNVNITTKTLSGTWR